MKKFALLLVAAFCLPVLGLTGCGGSGENTVIPISETEEMSEADQEAFDAGMEASMNEEGGN